MRLARALLLAVSAVAPVLGDYGQTSRCYLSRDVASKNILGVFLQNASDCVVDAEELLPCLYEKPGRSVMPMVAPLLDAIKRWQRYYRTDLAEAYASVGKEITTWNAWSYDRDWNIWDILRFHWEQTGWLCFYDHDPSLTDGLEPREAGLLSIFFTEKDGLRPPILKRGKTWTFNKTYACSAQSPADQLRQVNTITKLYDNIKPWGPSSWQAGLEAVIYREHFSTDPFLQALITGWHWGNYTCPEYMACAYRFKKGQLWLPRNARDMFRKISNKLLLGDKVCIVYKEPIPEPDKDTWYISGVGVTPSEEE